MNAVEVEHQQQIEYYAAVLTVTFDKATAYMNVVAIGGYAAFFGFWSLVGDQIAPIEKLAAGLFMGLSISIFVLFEVFKVYVFNQELHALSNVVNSTPETLDTHKRKFGQATEATALKMHRVWLWSFPITLVLGLLGAIGLLVAFSRKLIMC